MKVVTQSFDEKQFANYRQADGLMMVVLTVYMAVTVLIAWIYDPVLLFFSASILSAATWGLGLLSYFLFRGQLASRLIMAVLLMIMVGLQIHFGRGQLEFHFGVFVTLALLLMYRDWRPILVGAVTIGIHHILGDFLQSQGLGIYCLPEPSFYRILIHAAYVIVQTGFQIKIALMLQQSELESHQMAVKSNDLAMHSQTLTDQLQKTMGGLTRAVDEVQQRTDSVSASASQIAESAVDLSRRSSQSLERLTSTFQVSDHLADITTSTASAAEDARALVKEVVAEAEEGVSTFNKVIKTMEDIEVFSERISEFVSVINGVAFQTNILALNAAVESARAGEQGRGFAVVANEIRSLAERSGQAAREIEELIKSNASYIHNSVDSVKNAGKTMEVMEKSVSQVDTLVSGIAQNMQQQLNQLAEVNNALHDLRETANNNAALAEKSADSSKELQRNAIELNQAMQSMTHK